ncbi:UNVERIFIED_CONTAM: hypothetical protein LI965_09030, partial [Campylobacter jejuni]
QAQFSRRAILALGAGAGLAAASGCAKKSTEATPAGQATTASSGGSSVGTGSTTLTVFLSGDTNMQDLWEKGLVPGFK